MKQDPDHLPKLGRSARTLGVRVEGSYQDVQLDGEGQVIPGKGGMSVTVDDPSKMPPARRPRWINNGRSEDPLLYIEYHRIQAPLTVRIDRDAHAMIEPTELRLLTDYEKDIASTRPHWVLEAGR